MGANEYKKEVVIVLLTDEQYVVKWLSQYGALPRAQIIKMLQKPPQTAEKILRNLKGKCALRMFPAVIISDLTRCVSRISG